MPFRVLVIEDEDTNMKIIAMNLAMIGYEVLESRDPEHGLLVARRERPDVVLMDMMFKGAAFDGLEAIKRLKADPATAGIAIVAQTASVLDYLAAEVMAAGAAGLLHKPFRRQQLVDAIAAAAPHAPPPLVRLRAGSLHGVAAAPEG